MVVLGLGALILALRLDNIIGIMIWAYTIFTTGVIVPVAFGFFRGKLKLTANVPLQRSSVAVLWD